MKREVMPAVPTTHKPLTWVVFVVTSVVATVFTPDAFAPAVVCNYGVIHGARVEVQ